MTVLFLLFFVKSIADINLFIERYDKDVGIMITVGAFVISIIAFAIFFFFK